MRTADLDFYLPPQLIAQEPAARRPDARMLHYRRTTGEIAHRHVRDLPHILTPRDLLLFNGTSVIPAKFTVRKPTGGLVEGLWLETEPHWPFLRGRVLLKGLGSFTPGFEMAFDADPTARIQLLHKPHSEDGYIVQASEDFNRLIRRVGRMPLPPYIKRAKGSDGRDAADRERYQTVLRDGGSSVAAPTAGLHFDQPLLDKLESLGIEYDCINLEVGMGTFKPVTAADLDEHDMHRECWGIGEYGASNINEHKRTGGRLIAVGTTVVRTLESQPPGDLVPGIGETDLLIQPPYEFKHVDALLTNFHLPKSTLIALVDAFIGTDERRRLYDEAIREQYRFFSYGDCMLIE